MLKKRWFIFFSFFLFGVPFASAQSLQCISDEVNRMMEKDIAFSFRVPVPQAGIIDKTIVVEQGMTLQFPAGTWICKASPCIVVKDAAEVTGAGVFRTRLILDKDTPGPIISSEGFERLKDLNESELKTMRHDLPGDRKCLPGVKYVKITQLTLDGACYDGAPRSNGVEIYGLWFEIKDVAIERFSGDGLYTQFIAAGDVDPEGNDAMESYFIQVKLLSNKGNGWTMRGPHDSIVTGLIAANNGGWGIDVQHQDGAYSGGGLMLQNTHLYGNGNGLRTEAGANILAFGLESEANKGVGMLLRSNDSIVQGMFYANGTYGVQLGEGTQFAAANMLTLQIHNNKKAQMYWQTSGGYNHVLAVVFPNDPTQLFFEGKPTKEDQVLTTGPYAVQHFAGGISMDSDQHVYNIRSQQ